MAVEPSNEDDRQNTQGASATDTTSRPAGDSNDVEQYGVWVKAGPVDIGDDDESQEQFEMEDLKPEADEGELTLEEEELLGSLESEEEESQGPGVEDIDLEGLPTLSGGEADELTFENVQTEDQADLNQQKDESPEDDGAFELDLPDSNEEVESMEKPEESASILQKIEKDLLSIKEELTALKNEIYSLRSGAPKPEPEEERPEAESGFFEEDEDETIALTGDELDNILNTADITEQTGQSTASPEDTDFLMEEETPAEVSLIDREDVLVEEEESPPVDAEVSLAEEEAPAEESFEDFSMGAEEIEEINLEEPAAAPPAEEELLDLPEEEEIVLEDVPEEELSLEEPGEEAEEIELDLAGEGGEEESAFELDEELDLSPSEKQDLEVSEELLGEEELSDLSAPEPDEVELTEIEDEARDIATLEEAEEPVEEITELGDEELDLPEIEPVEDQEELEVETNTNGSLSDDLKSEIRVILKYMDQLLESLPEEKIEEFANSEYFDVYKRLFEELGLSA